MIQKLALATACALSFAGARATAETNLDVSISSGVFDRGEQLAADAVEAEAGVALALNGTVNLTASIYTLQPFGPDDNAFPSETDYAVGLAWSGAGYEAAVSAVHITFPGSADEATTELAGELIIDAPLSPTLAVFHDIDLEDKGMELSLSHEWPTALSGWTPAVLGRVGTVSPGEGDQRSYIGVEAALSHPIGQGAEFGIFARAEAADQDSFADEVRDGDILTSTDNGALAGVFVSASF